MAIANIISSGHTTRQRAGDGLSYRGRRWINDELVRESPWVTLKEAAELTEDFEPTEGEQIEIVSRPVEVIHTEEG